jgi:hypothetical protein
MTIRKICATRKVRGGAHLTGTLALLLLGACSSDEGPVETTREAAESVDPCSLVSEADAGQALGAPISESDRPREANNEYLGTCRYVAPRGQGLAVMTVMVHSQEYGRAGFRTAREQPFDSEDVAGVGDNAFWIGDPLNTIYVLKGDIYFAIGGDVGLEQARTLAVSALAGVP